MPLKMTLYKSSKETNVWADLKFVESTLKKLAKENKLSYSVIDIADFNETQLNDTYGKAIVPSVWNKYRIRTVFGSNRHSGCFFGKEQPALLVEGDIWGIYPHEKDGKKITIENFLENLSRTME